MSEGECHDRNHAGLARVMMNAMGRIRSLPDGTLGQDVAATAFAYERWLDEQITPTVAEIEAALQAVPMIDMGNALMHDIPAMARTVVALVEEKRCLTTRR